jgi:Zn-dependent peptidase ImmA (M78 family)
LKITVSERRTASELLEKRANAFAAAFLMPSEGIATLLNCLDKGKPSRAGMTIFDVATEGRIETPTRPVPHSQRMTSQDIAFIAHHFGVSYPAAAYRLSRLKHLSPKECEGRLAQVEFGKQYLKVLEMFEDLETPEGKTRSKRALRHLMAHRAIEAYRREAISRGK